jgi:hypothetical protein
MNKRDLEIGGRYQAKALGRRVIVRLDAIRTTDSERGGAIAYDVTDVETGEQFTFASAQRFRGVAGGPTQVDRRVIDHRSKVHETVAAMAAVQPAHVAAWWRQTADRHTEYFVRHRAGETGIDTLGSGYELNLVTHRCRCAACRAARDAGYDGKLRLSH